MKREGPSGIHLNSVCPAWLPSPCQSFLHLPILPYNSRLAPLSLSHSLTLPSLFAFGVFPSLLSIPPPLIQCELLS